VAHVAPKKGGKVRALKATFAVLCFGVGVAFVTGAIYGLVRPGHYSGLAYGRMAHRRFPPPWFVEKP
jgi:hypothetical protein